MAAEVVDVLAYRSCVALAGSVWLPPGGEPRGLVLMHPGSGPADRHNDVLFAPIRASLLDARVAVCSFDKRGVGASSGSWLEADITAQALDLVAELAAARRVVPGGALGLFGHSQGGWVVLEAARRVRLDFVITNSGPGVTPGEQESYSTRNRLRSSRLSADRVERALAAFDELLALIASGQPFAAWRHWLERADRASVDDLIEVGAFLPDDEQLWSFTAAILEHDPRPAMAEITVPLLTLLGALDPIVPVESSAAAYRACVRSGLLDLRILDGADHRMCRPGTEEFVPGYPDVVASFVGSRLAATS